VKKVNVVRDKSFGFAVRVINLYKFLQINKHEFTLSKQILKSGTSVGACIRESENAESRADFIHKLGLAQKEVNETLYWLELLNACKYISEDQFKSLNSDAVEIIKLLTSVIISLKSENKKKKPTSTTNF